MGWNIRRSVNLGPIRINASKSGIGYSVGVRGFRAGQDAIGRNYTASSIPGTGIYRRDYFKTAAAPKAKPTNPPHSQIPTQGTGDQAPVWLLCVGGAFLIYTVIRLVS